MRICSVKAQLYRLTAKTQLRSVIISPAADEKMKKRNNKTTWRERKSGCESTQAKTRERC